MQQGIHGLLCYDLWCRYQRTMTYSTEKVHTIHRLRWRRLWLVLVVSYYVWRGGRAKARFEICLICAFVHCIICNRWFRRLEHPGPCDHPVIPMSSWRRVRRAWLPGRIWTDGKSKTNWNNENKTRKQGIFCMYILQGWISVVFTLHHLNFYQYRNM